jgi:uncharacterized protein with von Willebrand factor type A (vWA) domain
MTRAPLPRLADNVVRFGRILRAAGLPIGPGRMLAAIEAARLVGLERREDFRTALAATFVERAEQRPLFDQAFAVFWRDPKLMERALQRMLPKAPGRLPPRAGVAALNNRLQQAFAPTESRRTHCQDDDVPIELDAALSVSAREVLAHKDFETMTLEELAAAKQLLRELRLPLPDLPARRSRPHAAGRALDLRTTVRHGLRTGGEWIVLRRRQRCRRPSALVVLCDISGSMARYSRMLLHFMHAVGSQRSGFHAFTVGTRLTNITRALRRRDVDQAVADVSRSVADWSGGTRLGACLDEFDRRWSRRLLAQGAVVLIVSDGLDCGEGETLAQAMQRLRRACRRIVWLNPLLRFDGFRPLAAGVRAMLPHVDDFIPAHDIASLSELGCVLSRMPARRRHRSHKENEPWK